MGTLSGLTAVAAQVQSSVLLSQAQSILLIIRSIGLFVMDLGRPSPPPPPFPSRLQLPTVAASLHRALIHSHFYFR